MTTARRTAFQSEALEDLGVRFLIDLLEGEIRHSPARLDLLASLGELYTAAGMYGKGLEVDRRLSALLPSDPTVHYNLACSLSLVGDVEMAFDALRRAVALGYRDFDYLERDADLRNVRHDPRFKEWFRKVRSFRPKTKP